MKILKKFPDTDCWIRTVREPKGKLEWTWSISNFLQIGVLSGPAPHSTIPRGKKHTYGVCDYVQSLGYKFSKFNSCEWFFRLYPDGINSLHKGYIMLQLCCSELERNTADYEVSLVNNIGERVYTCRGSFGGLSDEIIKFMDRSVLLSDKNVFFGNKITMHCCVTECGNSISKKYERKMFNANNESIYLLSQDFSSMLNDERFSDVKLKVRSSTKVFHAHKDILASRSSYFKKIFWDSDNFDDSQPLELPKCPHELCLFSCEVETLQHVLKFVYSNRCEGVPANLWKNIYCTSICLHLKSLEIISHKALLTHLDANEVRKYLFAHMQYEKKEDPLQHQIYASIHRCRDQIIEKNDWEDDSKENPELNSCIPALLDLHSLQKKMVTSSAAGDVESCSSTVTRRNIIWSISNWKTYFKDNSKLVKAQEKLRSTKAEQKLGLMKALEKLDAQTKRQFFLKRSYVLPKRRVNDSLYIPPDRRVNDSSYIPPDRRVNDLHPIQLETKTLCPLISSTFPVATDDDWPCCMTVMLDDKKDIYISMKSIDGKFKGEIKFQFSVMNEEGIVTYSTDWQKECLIPGTTEQYPKVCINPSKHTILTYPCNDTLILRCCTIVRLVRPYLPKIDSTDDDFAKDMGSLMMDRNKRCEFLIKCDWKDFKVHKYVLYSRSQVFNTMFSNLENIEDEVIIKDAEPETVKAMLKYIYTGRIEDLCEITAKDLLKLSDRYDVHGLKEICSLYLSTVVSISNVSDLLELAVTYNDEVLKTAACEFISFHADAIASEVNTGGNTADSNCKKDVAESDDDVIEPFFFCTIL